MISLQADYFDTNLRLYSRGFSVPGKSKDAAGRSPDQLCVDNGYWSGDLLQAQAQSRTEAYIVIGNGKKTNKIPLDASNRKWVKSNFEYDEAINTFTCGRTGLKINRRNPGRWPGVSLARGSLCWLHVENRCCHSQKGEVRTINTDDKEPLRQQVNIKKEQQASNELSGKRKVIDEPVFGQIKTKIAAFPASGFKTNKKSQLFFE
jgi:hypothetical protein